MASYGSNIISGAGTGAAIGSAAGPVGALIGGGVGALAGVFSAWEQSENEKERRKILEKAKQQFGIDQAQIEQLMDAYYSDPENFLSTREDVDAYKKALSEYNPKNFAADVTAFKYTDENGREKTVDDFLNPYMDKVIGDTTKRISHSAAGAGVGRGTGAANAIATGVAQKENELYNTALNAYNADRSQAYTEWAGNIDRMQARLNALKSATDSKLNAQGNLANDYAQQRQNEISDKIAAKQATSQGNLQLASLALM